MYSGEQGVSITPMKNIFFCIIVVCLTSCISNRNEPYDYSDDLPKPNKSDSFIVLMANQTDFDTYIRNTLEAEKQVEKESDGYYYFLEKLTSDAFELHEVLDEYIYSSNGFPLCYNPGHFISYSSESGPVTLEICFECGRVKANINGWEKWLRIESKAEKEISTILENSNIIHPKYLRANNEE